MFEAGVSKMIKVFPLNSEVLKFTGIINPINKDNFTAGQGEL